MPVCVRLMPYGTPIGYNSATNIVVSSGGQVIGVDPACSSGLLLLTQAEIDGIKSSISIDTSSDPERVADMASLFYAFVAVLVVVWGVKQLLNLFTGDTEK